VYDLQGNLFSIFSTVSFRRGKVGAGMGIRPEIDRFRSRLNLLICLIF